MRTTESLNPTSLALYLRVYHGLTQREVAQSCGLTCNDVCRFELGHPAISYGKLQALAGFYKVTTDALFYDDFQALAARRGRRGNAQALRQRIHARQEYCEQLGDRGEAWVAQLEREKLKNTPWAEMVNPNYAGDPQAHFDLMSFDPDTGEAILIEVKTTAKGAESPLYFSSPEWDLLRHCAKTGIRYELHRVYRIDDPRQRGREIYTAREVLERFAAVPQNYMLCRKEPVA